MTEEKFAEKVEVIADKFEQKVEATADKFDKTMTKQYRRHPFIFRFISLFSELGLIIGAFVLRENGYKTAWAWCFGLGIVGILTDVFKMLFFRRK